MVTVGLDDNTIDSLTGTLLRMKTVLIQEAHAARRGADVPEVHAEAHAAPEAAHRGPGAVHRGPEAAHRRPEAVRRVPEAAHHEAETTELA
jgi:hypothetical protein